jgi:hypothetical protein
VRNAEWYHLVNDDIISMPDKWEYPWYAAWDLAFHAIPLALVDVEFAKRQLTLLLDEAYQHPNGQEDGFFYDVMRLPNGEASRLKVRSLVGLLPLCATTVVERKVERYPALFDRARRFLSRRPDMLTHLHLLPPGEDGRLLLAIATEDKLRRILPRLLDENEFQAHTASAPCPASTAMRRNAPPRV